MIGRIERKLSVFEEPRPAAYGRQLPHPEATPIAAHARLFNYPPCSETRTLADVPRLGLKTCFVSNSFAAYRVQALREVGGFASDLILAEDMHLAARLLLAGHAVRYQAEAVVYHSHNQSLVEEFQRYFDTGVFHAQQTWLTERFGGAGREGLKFLRSEILHLLRHAPWRLPEAGLRTLLKALAFRLGRGHARLPRAWRPLPTTPSVSASGLAMYLVAMPLAAPVRKAPIANTCTMAQSSPVSSLYRQNIRPALLPNTAVLEIFTP